MVVMRFRFRNFAARVSMLINAANKSYIFIKTKLKAIPHNSRVQISFRKTISGISQPLICIISFFKAIVKRFSNAF